MSKLEHGVRIVDVHVRPDAEMLDTPDEVGLPISVHVGEGFPPAAPACSTVVSGDPPTLRRISLGA